MPESIQNAAQRHPIFFAAIGAASHLPSGELRGLARASQVCLLGSLVALAAYATALYW